MLTGNKQKLQEVKKKSGYYQMLVFSSCHSQVPLALPQVACHWGCPPALPRDTFLPQGSWSISTCKTRRPGAPYWTC